jgi:hypothetical protein
MLEIRLLPHFWAARAADIYVLHLVALGGGDVDGSFR